VVMESGCHWVGGEWLSLPWWRVAVKGLAGEWLSLGCRRKPSSNPLIILMFPK
jgi:hypothetical protein